MAEQLKEKSQKIFSTFFPLGTGSDYLKETHGAPDFFSCYLKTKLISQILGWGYINHLWELTQPGVHGSHPWFWISLNFQNIMYLCMCEFSWERIRRFMSQKRLRVSVLSVYFIIRWILHENCVPLWLWSTWLVTEVARCVWELLELPVYCYPNFHFSKEKLISTSGRACLKNFLFHIGKRER